MGKGARACNSQDSHSSAAHQPALGTPDRRPRGPLVSFVGLHANLIEEAQTSKTIVLAITEKSQAEVLRLEDAIIMPDRVRNTTDIEKALVEWDAMCREYTEAGGGVVSEHREVGVFVRMLPASLHEDVLKEFNEFDEQPEALRRWIRDRVQWLKWSDASRVASTTSWKATKETRIQTTASLPSAQSWPPL